MAEFVDDALRELSDYADDVSRSTYQTVLGAMRRYTDRLFDDGPLESYVRGLPNVDFDSWYTTARETKSAMVGSGILDWPSTTPERLALQVELIQRLAVSDIDLMAFCRDFAYGGKKYNANIREFVTQIFRPFHRDMIRLIRRKSRSTLQRRNTRHPALSSQDDEFAHPSELSQALQRFRADHGTVRTAFVIMQFGKSQFHSTILAAIRETLKVHGIQALRADDKDYADDLLANVRVYMHGCEFGVAVFERIRENEVNPNVSLEVGYMLGIGKPVCLLKEATLETLQTDLAGRLYKEFEIERVRETLHPKLEKWLEDRDLLS